MAGRLARGPVVDEHGLAQQVRADSLSLSDDGLPSANPLAALEIA